MDEGERGLRVVHQLRAITVELDLVGAEFAQRNSLHPTDLRALICLLDAARAHTLATPGWLGRQLGLNSAGTTALVDRLESRYRIEQRRLADSRLAEDGDVFARRELERDVFQDVARTEALADGGELQHLRIVLCSPGS